MATSATSWPLPPPLPDVIIIVHHGHQHSLDPCRHHCHREGGIGSVLRLPAFPPSDLDNNLISCTPMMNWGCHSKEGLSDWCYRQERSSLSMIAGVAMALAAVIDKEEKIFAYVTMYLILWALYDIEGWGWPYVTTTQS
uniref:Uncharacterized protein n=2 Tax=Oryza sativa subsp. japonica TaxID=39947 RepID=Q6F2G4_ORYSJ|nr:hypothetical protein [Oryza sativa Japonica Group]ABF97275.1 hypothetical protein LOC_Os03g38140 [Oryza sativa Japonica Group]